MPYSYSWTEKRFYCKFSGIVDWQDLQAATGTLYGNSKWDNLTEVIIDFTRESQIVISDKRIRELAYTDRAASKYNKKLNFAFVAMHPIAKKIAHTYIANSQEIGISWNYEVFDNLEMAMKWFNQIRTKSKLGAKSI